jgi:hypothetical protein
MQTFMCYFSHAKTAADLDQARLGKQRVEVVQILKALRGETEAYANHPAVKMWKGYEPALLLYGLVICHEWRVKRGHEDKVWYQLEEMSPSYWDKNKPQDNRKYQAPPWARDTWVLRSHRSNLIRKARHVYGDKYPGTPEAMPYLWPVIEPQLEAGYYLRLSKPDAARLDTGERVMPPGVQVMEFVPPSGLRENYAVVIEEDE